MVKYTNYLVKIGLLAWLAVIGFDLFLHAGILAGLYSEPSPFLLSPEDAFRLIPLGYVSFLVLIILLFWLMLKFSIIGWKSGLIFWIESWRISLGSIDTRPLVNIDSECKSTGGMVLRPDSGTWYCWNGDGKRIIDRSSAFFAR